MKRLVDLELTKIAFVDAPANPHAQITIWKRAGEPPNTDTEAPVADDKTDFDKAVAEKVFAIEAEHQSMKATLDELNAMDNDTLAALRGIAVAPVEKSEDDVFKNLAPEVRERIEKAEQAQADANERIAKMEREQRVERFTKAAEEYANIAAPAELGPMLEELDRTAPDLAKSLTPVLKAANARISEGDLFSEYGKSGSDESDPFAKTVAQAAEIRKADPTISETDALQQAMAKNADAQRQAFTK